VEDVAGNRLRVDQSRPLRGYAADVAYDTQSTVQELLSAIPAGCTWLVPVVGDDGQVTDFRVGAASGGADIYHRGTDRVGATLSELYPSMVDGPLWTLYREVVASGVAGRLPEFRYEEKRSGVVANSLFEVSVYPVLGGLLVWWHRVDEDRRRLDRTEVLGRLGWAEYDLATGVSDWSPGMYRLFARDPRSGPMSRSEQSAAIVPEDRGLAETAWQTLDSGASSDVTVRFRLGGSVKHLRILSEVARDADGTPLKVYAVIQDVTAREDSRSEIERLTEQLRNREMTALAEHRLAGQLQNMIQPIPREPLPLVGLEAIVSYLPAESAVQVSGDWYHAQSMPDGHTVLAIGDVAGHGLAAASGMAHLRYALVAWLSIGIRDPGILLEHLNNLCRQLDITATAVVAIYDPAATTLHWARAGHRVPLLGRAGTATFLDRPPGLLLGAEDNVRYPARSVPLCADDLVLFYTDGLVERRGAGADVLEDQVRESLADATAGTGPDSLSRLNATLGRPSPYDDTCTLLVRVVR
jgi:serine phosphatase RsbU (regulator of sigma subunit)